jgi:hypothetical protein
LREISASTTDRIAGWPFLHAPNRTCISWTLSVEVLGCLQQFVERSAPNSFIEDRVSLRQTLCFYSMLRTFPAFVESRAATM